MEQRVVPGSSVRFSALTVTVDPPSVAPPSLDARVVAGLQRCRARGVVTFDVGDARFPERAERLIAAAFPSPGPEVGVIVARSVESLAGERRAGVNPSDPVQLEAAIEESLGGSRRRLGSVPVKVVEWRSSATELSFPEGGRDTPPIPRLSDPATILALRLSTGGRPPSGASQPKVLFSGELSLLDHSLESILEQMAARHPIAFLARNPLAEGRLDGTRFSHSTALSGPGDGPIDLRRLRREFDPVVRLGFLTAGHRRTLAQAALRFVLIRPWVVSAVVPLPAPERMDELLGFEASPPLDREELERVYELK